MTFSEQILDFYFTLPRTLALPDGVESIYPFDHAKIRKVMQQFFEKYYVDTSWLESKMVDRAVPFP